LSLAVGLILSRTGCLVTFYDDDILPFILGLSPDVYQPGGAFQFTNPIWWQQVMVGVAAILLVISERLGIHLGNSTQLGRNRLWLQLSWVISATPGILLGNIWSQRSLFVYLDLYLGHFGNSWQQLVGQVPSTTQRFGRS
jgi:hypothetical protein